jgi:hypothetical protein
MILIFLTSVLNITKSNSISETFNDIVPASGAITLTTSTFIGGNAYDHGSCIMIDEYGYRWIIGASTSSNYPTTGLISTVDDTHNSPGYYDIVVSKFSTDGKDLLFSTFIGGDGTDVPLDTVFDSNGNIWIVGYTASHNFPTTSNALNATYGLADSIELIYDGFICKLSVITGTVVYATYLATNHGSTEIKSCAFDSNGDLWFTGDTNAYDYPTTSQAFDPDKSTIDDDIFLSKLSFDGSQLLYSTFFGGSNHDRVEDLIIDDSDNIWISGRTYSSSGFPITISNAYDKTMDGDSDAFISKFDFTESNVLQYSTFLGGSNNEVASEIEFDSEGNIWILGDTSSTNFPFTTNAYNKSFNGGTGLSNLPIHPSDMFFTLLAPDNPTGDDLIYSSFLGGSDNDNAKDLLIDIDSNLWITGYTASSDIPTTFKAPDSSYNGDDDVWILKFSPTGEQLKFSTYLGSPGADFGYSLAYDPVNTMVWMTGFGDSGFQTTSGAYDTTNNGYSDIIVVGLNDTSVINTISTTTTTKSGAESTPGFSIMVILIIIPLYIVIKRRKNLL